MKEVLVQLGDNIKKARELRNLTQEYVASQIGIQQQSYSKIELGETDISFTKLSKLAEIFGITLFDLINLKERLVFYIQYNNQNNSNNYNGVNPPPHNSIVEIYDKYLKSMKEEIDFLRGQLDKKNVE